MFRRQGYGTQVQILPRWLSEQLSFFSYWVLLINITWHYQYYFGWIDNLASQLTHGLWQRGAEVTQFCCPHVTWLACTLSAVWHTADKLSTMWVRFPLLYYVKLLISEFTTLCKPPIIYENKWIILIILNILIFISIIPPLRFPCITPPFIKLTFPFKSR